jgi:hypothetical protein
MMTRSATLVLAIMAAVLIAAGMDRASADPLTPRFGRSADSIPLSISGATALPCGCRGLDSKRQRRYARGFDGSYVCQEEARTSGYRRSLLGLR